MKVSDEFLMGHTFPRYMGLAYHDPLRRYVVMYPIPFNIIIAALRNLWIKMGNGIKQGDFEYMQALGQSRTEGFQDGLESGIAEGKRLQIEDCKREIERFLREEKKRND